MQVLTLLFCTAPFLAGVTVSTENWSQEVDRIPNDCGLVGKWKNELNSTVIFSRCRNGQLFGLYNSLVGNASYYYGLSGRYTVSGPKNDTVELGWSVAWNNKKHGNSNSVTSWNGIYYSKEKTIYTQWLLTSYAPRQSLWASTLVNHDEFKKV